MSRKSTHRRRLTLPRLSRDAGAYLLGIALAVNEGFIAKGDRVSVWGAVLGLIFGPAYWRRLDAQRDAERAEERKESRDQEQLQRARDLAELLDGLDALRRPKEGS